MNIQVQRRGEYPHADPGHAFANWKNADERWLFVSPHDDDVVIGGGILLQLAVAHGVAVRCIITSDGRQGYCSPEQRADISNIRYKECHESFAMLNIDDVHWLAYPDSDIDVHSGRRKAQPGSPNEICGSSGLQNSYTYHLRDFRPTRLFLATSADYHPDHQFVHRETLISIFHAQGDIWPELGSPLSEIPSVYELAIYCPFPEPPTIRIVADNTHLQHKLKAIEAYRSQTQIASIVTNIRNGGAVEHLREIAFALYTPAIYDSLFL